ncbi:hypothetical protein SAMN05216249_1203 [Acetitomaculum ruminis DSM 5522]|uniref:Exonuclease domain-containing protein n=1 Tax=Acetitomaculum ruminis DSM 5522 TaxID=1120918 RepID=A0A1I1A172_9FIRM|nr:hypothetical protein [Acetitomaculum ruminis]SFB31685.1 hypothetical protein SAMN05216249_1203 [Acetitomaculum ruminis DSM 5522]
MGLFDSFYSKENTYKQELNTLNNSSLKPQGECFAVIDTETTWSDEVMSIGIVIADSHTNTPVDTRYYIIDPIYKKGGMYSGVLDFIKKEQTIKTTRKEALDTILFFLGEYSVERIFAYNAKFDFNHLPELRNFYWYDIMRIAAYNQYNKKIPSTVQCCKTGRIKKGYGVEPIYRMLSGNQLYREIHNALMDAIDELKIIEMLGYDIDVYNIGRI